MKQVAYSYFKYDDWDCNYEPGMPVDKLFDLGAEKLAAARSELAQGDRLIVAALFHLHPTLWDWRSEIRTRLVEPKCSLCTLSMENQLAWYEHCCRPVHAATLFGVDEDEMVATALVLAQRYTLPMGDRKYELRAGGDVSGEARGSLG